MFMASVEKFPSNNCLGHREGDGYSWLTYKETAERAAAVGSALVKVGLAPHGRVGVYGANSPEWMIAMQVGKHLLQRPTRCATCKRVLHATRCPWSAHVRPSSNHQQAVHQDVAPA
jgi:hypothetical protein